VWRHTSA